MFKCDKCGQCCKNLHRSSVYDGLHDGDGICKFLKGNICAIYETRPLICDVEKSYDVFFKDKLSYQAYIQLNYDCCEILKKAGQEE